MGSIMGAKALGSVARSIGEQAEQKDRSTEESGAGARVSYTCQHCGAPLGEGVEVSPHGDVKCNYCNTWFNIHGK